MPVVPWECETNPADMHCNHMDQWQIDLAEHKTSALLVVRHNRIVHEWYAPECGPDVPHYTASLAKALVGGTSLGLAIADDLISPDNLACQYIPAWRVDPLRSKITIAQLASHSSSLEDAETLGKGHMDQGGWKEAFWRRDPDPFTIARDQAPVSFEPGSAYAYSNTGMAMLAYAVTASLPANQSIRELLEERLMTPLGIPQENWQIGYGTTYEIDGLRLNANWGGGSYTARAVARVGQLMLDQGRWGNQQLISAETVRRMLRSVGAPRPPRAEELHIPTPGLGWWLNIDGTWPNLPRDAFAGAGAGQQILLVVPSLDLVVVRLGEAFTGGFRHDAFWPDVNRYLIEPLLDSLKPVMTPVDKLPYPASPVIRGINWAPINSMVRQAYDSDNWPTTWGDDDRIYTAYGDGCGFAPYVDHKIGLGFAAISGTPDNPLGENIRSASGENEGMGANGIKASGIVMIDGVLYMLGRNAGNAIVARSTDHARTWEWADWRFETSFGYPGFVNFGRNYASARDEYVYIHSSDGDSAYLPTDQMVLARVPRERIIEQEAYTFCAGLKDGQPRWSADIAERAPIFINPGRCSRSSMVYNVGLGRYLWWQVLTIGQEPGPRFCGGFAVYDAPEPWGPWTTVYSADQWDIGPGEMGGFPARWMSEDGRECALVSSGNDYFSVRKLRLLC